MADLTGIINYNQTAEAINADYEARYVPRSRLGLSQCGHECQRYLWYTHHNYPRKQPDGRTLRLFQLGNIIEDQVILDLKSAGFYHHSSQKEVTFNWDDIVLKGHIDGIVEGLIESSQPHLFECKSANDKKFKELIKAGSYEKWNPIYKAQVHIYMLGLKLKRALVVVYNKNDSTLYTERIRLDREYAINTLERAFRAIQMTEPPERLCPSASWYAAKLCDYYKECFK